MDFNKEVLDATKYLNENTTDPKVKKATEIMLQHYNAPKKDYSGVTSFINGNRDMNNSKLGEGKANDVLSSIFGDKNAMKNKAVAEKKTADENAKIENERIQKENEENAKADKLKKRKMHQQALVSSRTGQQKTPQMPQGAQLPMLGM